MTKEEMTQHGSTRFIPLFVSPLMQVQLDLDLEKLTELVFQIQNKDKKGVQESNIGGWQSTDIYEEKHKEFIRLKRLSYR